MYRTFITDQPPQHRQSVGGAARAVIILIHTALIIAWEGALHSGTSASAIKVACTPISSLISDKCLGFGHHWSIRSAHSRTHHTHTLSLTHALLDPMNDQSKDYAPGGTLRGSWGSVVASLAHCRHSAPIGCGTGFLLCACVCAAAPWPCGSLYLA